MTDYTKLVEALRCCEFGWSARTCDNCEYSKTDCQILLSDAAAAIEALQAQLPKRGKWIIHPEVKNIYGGVYIECPFCGEKYVVQNVSDEKFCRNCGADMRKMEVQDGKRCD